MKQNEPSREQPWISEAEARATKAEAQVAAQVAWIAELRRLRHDTTEATTTLIALTDQLQRCYEELGLHQAGGWQQARRPPHSRGGRG